MYRVCSIYGQDRMVSSLHKYACAGHSYISCVFRIFVHKCRKYVCTYVCLLAANSNPYCTYVHIVSYFMYTLVARVSVVMCNNVCTYMYRICTCTDAVHV